MEQINKASQEFTDSGGFNYEVSERLLFNLCDSSVIILDEGDLCQSAVIAIEILSTPEGSDNQALRSAYARVAERVIEHSPSNMDLLERLESLTEVSVTK